MNHSRVTMPASPEVCLQSEQRPSPVRPRERLHRRTASSAGRRPCVIDRPGEQLSPTALAREIGPCVYFLRTTDDLVKVGHTANVAERKRGLTADGWRSLLAVVPGTREDEQRIHAQLALHLARGREYYRPAPEVLALVNSIRDRLGVPDVEAW